MNYSFPIAMAVFLVVSAPFLLIDAHREGRRRRNRTMTTPMAQWEYWTEMVPRGNDWSDMLRVRGREHRKVELTRSLSAAATADPSDELIAQALDFVGW